MFKFIIGILLGIICVIFFLQNAETVTFVFLAWHITISRALMLITVLAAGIIIGWIFGGIKYFKKSKR